MNAIDVISQTVTIASNAGTLNFSAYGVVGRVYVTPEGSPSACNGAVYQVVQTLESEIIASEALSTSAPTVLYDQSADSGYLLITPQAPLRIKFDTGTNDDQYTVTVLLVR